MNQIAVIDTETNWADAVMSIGVVLADRESLKPTDCRYYLFDPEIEIGGMYDTVLLLPQARPTGCCSRARAMQALDVWLQDNGVTELFAYNARFDRSHLPELSDFDWHDIMKIAAYRQHNPWIGDTMPCCATGRLKRQYGVEAILRLMTGDQTYRETHNALLDAADELHIMQLLKLTRVKYPCCRI